MSGTVYDPAGKLPLYNVVVYAPTATLAPIPPGVSCDRCGVRPSGNPSATTLSDARGQFRLEGIPSGANVPLVFQVGKWRRQVTIPSVAACADTPLTDVNLTRLPRNQTEGDIPRIAVTTGGSDALECLVRKLGIADSEFTTDAGTGRVHLFVGGRPDTGVAGANSFAPTLNGGAPFPHATTLWGNATKLLGYDMMLLSCEGSQYGDVKMPFTANIKRFADEGGRLLASHLHMYWLTSGPTPWPATATYIGAAGTEPPSPVTGTIDTSFPKGAALADWSVAVGASTTRGQIDLWQPQHSVAAPAGATQRWIFLPQNINDLAVPRRPATQLMTFNTPVEAAPAAQCGRVAHTDVHISAAPAAAGEMSDDSDPSLPFPTGCRSASLSPQEKALAFLFFDLSGCVLPDAAQPAPPPI